MPSVNDFIVDFSKEEKSAGGSPKVKPGTYRARVVGGKTGVSDNKGTPYLEVAFRLLDGAEGKKKTVIRERLYVTPKAYSRFRLLLQALGKKVPAKLNLTKISAAIKGGELYLEMENEPPREGYTQARSRVGFQGFINPDDYDPEAVAEDDEEDIDDELEDDDIEDDDEDDELEDEEDEEEEEPAPKKRKRAPAKKAMRKKKVVEEEEDEDDDLDLEDDEDEDEEEEEEEPAPKRRRKPAAKKAPAKKRKKKAVEEDEDEDDEDLDDLDLESM